MRSTADCCNNERGWRDVAARRPRWPKRKKKQKSRGKEWKTQKETQKHCAYIVKQDKTRAELDGLKQTVTMQVKKIIGLAGKSFSLLLLPSFIL